MEQDKLIEFDDKVSFVASDIIDLKSSNEVSIINENSSVFVDSLEMVYKGKRYTIPKVTHEYLLNVQKMKEEVELIKILKSLEYMGQTGVQQFRLEKRFEVYSPALERQNLLINAKSKTKHINTLGFMNFIHKDRYGFGN